MRTTINIVTCVIGMCIAETIAAQAFQAAEDVQFISRLDLRTALRHSAAGTV